MSFAQFTDRSGLRDIEMTLGLCGNDLYHAGLCSVPKSTLAEANEKRNWMIYRDFAQTLIKEAKMLYRDDYFRLGLKEMVYALDSTTIRLCLELSPWAEFHHGEGTVKMHTLIDLRGSIPSYIITSTVAAPALVTLGIPPIAAHMFCFYFAMFANLTPPVALASFAAAGISGGDPMKTGWASVKLALAGFLLPYMFVYNQELLMLNTTLLKGLQVAVTAAIGAFLISVAVEGFFFAKVNPVLRVAALIGAYCLIDSRLVTDLAGLAICVVIFVLQKMNSNILAGLNG